MFPFISGRIGPWFMDISRLEGYEATSMLQVSPDGHVIQIQKAGLYLIYAQVGVRRYFKP